MWKLRLTSFLLFPLVISMLGPAIASRSFSQSTVFSFCHLPFLFSYIFLLILMVHSQSRNCTVFTSLLLISLTGLDVNPPMLITG
ncbi:hypothetical protein B0H65DRAFT_477515 [Neurospora tetraspora]|uniref:NADH dehydrogenase subunit 4 n=1 Tax=Neurospora tetraspora TaxID=94610 RepID=A0AAE0MMG3_9PEZI|nr:hypothetical protein B0H65DRAFT_477515 [Neurospora tetraspora]